MHGPRKEVEVKPARDLDDRLRRQRQAIRNVREKLNRMEAKLKELEELKRYIESRKTGEKA